MRIPLFSTPLAFNSKSNQTIFLSCNFSPAITDSPRCDTTKLHTTMRPNAMTKPKGIAFERSSFSNGRKRSRKKRNETKKTKKRKKKNGIYRAPFQRCIIIVIVSFLSLLLLLILSPLSIHFNSIALSHSQSVISLTFQ